MIRNSPGSSKNAPRSPTITTSTSRNSAVPRSPYRSGVKVVSFFQARSGAPGGAFSASGGIGWHSTSPRMPLASSVRQTKRNGPLRCRRTIAYSRFTYSGPYLRPHFMHRMLRSASVGRVATSLIGSGPAALLRRHRWPRARALDLAARGQPLVAEHAQDLDLGPLAAALAVLQHLDVLRPRPAVFARRALLRRLRPPQHQQLADMLDRRGAERIGQLFEHRLARGAVVRQHAHLDQAVRVQGRVALPGHAGGQAAGADDHDRIEVVRFGAMGLALGRGQLDLCHPRIIE